MNENNDQALTCIDCKQPFVFTDGERAFFQEKFGDTFTPPKRCKPCRVANKAKREQTTGTNAYGGYSTGRSSAQPAPAAAPAAVEEAPRRRRMVGAGRGRGWGGDDE